MSPEQGWAFVQCGKKLSSRFPIPDSLFQRIVFSRIKSPPRYMIQTAQAVNAATPASIAIHDIDRDAIAKGHGNDNITGIARLFSYVSWLIKP
jgi:hypothetical protein